MSDQNGIKMRIIALDEIMKCCSEVGRTHDKDELKALLKELYSAAKTRREFLSAIRTDNDQD